MLGELNELGLAGLAVPEAHGGMGFGAVEAMVVMEELGRGLVNAPYAQAALVVPTLLSGADDALQGAWLPKIAAGEALVVLAQQEVDSRYRLNKVATKATEKAGRLDADRHQDRRAGGRRGRCLRRQRTHRRGRRDGIALFLVEAGADGVQISGYPTQDGARAADLVLADTPATLVTRDGLAALEHGVDVGIAALCAEGVGLMDRMIAVTVDYMHQRKQFGVPIASFQALRHRVADVKMQLELARSMSYFASLKLGEAAGAAAPCAVAGQGAAGRVGALRRPAVHPAAWRHRRHRRIHQRALLQAPDDARAELRRQPASPGRGQCSACRTRPASSPDERAIKGPREGHFAASRRPGAA